MFVKVFLPIIVIAIGWITYLYMKYPIINDVSTTFDQLLDYNNQLGEYDPAKISKQQEGYPELQPLSFEPASAPKVLACLRRTMDSMSGWKIVKDQLEADGLVYLVAQTKLLRFKDDVIIQVIDDRIHMRSKSRLGRADFGANANRIKDFLQQVSHCLNS